MPKPLYQLQHDIKFIKEDIWNYEGDQRKAESEELNEHVETEVSKMIDTMNLGESPKIEKEGPAIVQQNFNNIFSSQNTYQPDYSGYYKPKPNYYNDPYQQTSFYYPQQESAFQTNYNSFYKGNDSYYNSYVPKQPVKQTSYIPEHKQLFPLGANPYQPQGLNQFAKPEQRWQKDNSFTNLNELITNLISYCKDHSGSRIVQNKYQEASEEDKKRMFEIILPEVLNLSIDTFGNYVIQKLFELSGRVVRDKMIGCLESHIQKLTMHMYGCRVVQKAIEYGDVENVKMVFEELKPSLKTCIEDQNGNHVIQKLIEKCDDEDFAYIFKIVQGRIYNLSSHQYGCRVIQKVFEFCKKDHKELIMTELRGKIFYLTKDQYGNYVVQHILEKEGVTIVDDILKEIKGSIFELSTDKYSSNVLEKSLKYGTERTKRLIIEEVLEQDDENK